MTKYETIKTLEEKFDCKIKCRMGGTRPNAKAKPVEIFTICAMDGHEIADVFGYRELVKVLKECEASLRRLRAIEMLIEMGY